MGRKDPRGDLATVHLGGAVDLAPQGVVDQGPPLAAVVEAEVPTLAVQWVLPEILAVMETVARQASEMPQKLSLAFGADHAVELAQPAAAAAAAAAAVVVVCLREAH